MEDAERRQPLRASEKPLRATGSGREAGGGERGEAWKGWAGEEQPGRGGGEGQIVRRSCLRSSMPCMPVVSQAGNQVTWNHFFLCAHRCGPSEPSSAIRTNWLRVRTPVF